MPLTLVDGLIRIERISNISSFSAASPAALA